jgi:hypothetical protein
MERLRFRSTSLVDLQAELHQADLLREIRPFEPDRRPTPRRRGLPFGLTVLVRRITG